MDRLRYELALTLAERTVSDTWRAAMDCPHALGDECEHLAEFERATERLHALLEYGHDRAIVDLAEIARRRS